MVAVAIGGAALIGGAATIIGSGEAASAQENAAQQATNAERQQQAQTRSDLMPYQQEGQWGMNALQSKMGYLTSPFNPTMQQLEKTPGYQFTLQQGLKTVNNEMGARGLLNSGAVMKGASQYATGLADSTYLDQFNVDQQNKANIYNKLMGMTQLGENAAAQTGAYGTQIAQNIGSNYIGAGNAAAAGYMGMASGIGQAANGIGMAFLPPSFYSNNLYGGGGMGGGMNGAPVTGSFYGNAYSDPGLYGYGG